MSLRNLFRSHGRFRRALRDLLRRGPAPHGPPSPEHSDSESTIRHGRRGWRSGTPPGTPARLSVGERPGHPLEPRTESHVSRCQEELLEVPLLRPGVNPVMNLSNVPIEGLGIQPIYTIADLYGGDGYSAAASNVNPTLSVGKPVIAPVPDPFEAPNGSKTSREYVVIPLSVAFD